MTVSSREHLPINTEKLLPGARSAALLWQGAALLGGAALGAGQVYGGAAPFGLALVIGCPPAYCVAAALGTLAAGLAFARYHRVAVRQFGGTTGDLAGWFLQKCELWMLAALAASQWLGVL